MSYPTHPLLTPLLALPAALYGAVMSRRNRRYDRAGQAAAPDLVHTRETPEAERRKLSLYASQ